MHNPPPTDAAGAVDGPWSAEHGWRWVRRYTRSLAQAEGPEVARAYVLSALAAELAGLLVLAVRAAELDTGAARAGAWADVRRLAPAARRAIAGAAGIVDGIGATVRRGARMVDHLTELADTAPPSASSAPGLAEARLPPAPVAADAATLRQWLVRSGAQPTLEILAAAGAALPGIEPDCRAWAADLTVAWRALE